MNDLNKAGGRLAGVNTAQLKNAINDQIKANDDLEVLSIREIYRLKHALQLWDNQKMLSSDPEVLVLMVEALSMQLTEVANLAANVNKSTCEEINELLNRDDDLGFDPSFGNDQAFRTMEMSELKHEQDEIRAYKENEAR